MPTPMDIFTGILNAMVSERGYTYTVAGNVQRTVRVRTYEEAADKFIRVLDDQVAEGNLPEQLAAFRAIKLPEPFTSPSALRSRFDAHPEEMTARLAYSHQLRMALKPYIRRQCEQTKLWKDTEKQIFGRDKDGNCRITIPMGRHCHYLIETEDTPQNRRRNEKIVAVNALATGKITPDQFEEVRYQAWLSEGYRKDQAREHAREERQYGVEYMVDCYQEKAEYALNHLEEYRQAAAKILGGGATPQEMKEALAVLEHPGMYFLFTATSIMPLIDSTLSQTRRQELDAYAHRIEQVGSTMSGLYQIVHTYAMPQYAYLDPQELYASGINQTNASRVDPNILNYTQNQNASVVNMLQGMGDEIAEKYGFRDVDMANYPMEQTIIFEKKGATLLIDVQSLDLEHAFANAMKEDAPGRYVDKFLKRDAEGLLGRHRAAEERFRAAAEKAAPGQAAAGEEAGKAEEAKGAEEAKRAEAYEKIWKQLDALKEKRLGDEGSAEACQTLSVEFRSLLESVNAYLALAQGPTEADQERRSLAGDVKEFADQKLMQIRRVGEHRETVRRTAAARETAEAAGFTNLQILDADTFACRNDGGELMLLHRKEQDGKSVYTTDEPGAYLDSTYPETLGEMRNSLSKVMNKIAAEGKQPSLDLMALESVLRRAENVRLGNHPGQAACTDMGAMLHEIKETAEDYLFSAGESEEIAKEGGRSLARDVIRFADERREELGLVEQHLNCELQRAAKTVRFDSDVESMGSVTSQKIHAKDVPFGVTRRQAADSAIGDYIFNRTEIGQMQDRTVIVGDQDDLSGLITVHPEEAFDKVNKEILAAYVVNELVKTEEQLFPGDESKRPICGLAATGHLSDLIGMVQNSESFLENIRSQDLSECGDYSRLQNEGVPAKVAHDVFKTYMKAQKNAQQNAPERGGRRLSQPNLGENREVAANAAKMPNRNSVPNANAQKAGGMGMGGH